MDSIVASAAASGSASGERLEEGRLPPPSPPPPKKPKIDDDVQDKSKNLGYVCSDDDIDEWQPERISDENMERYRKQVKESEGYDVDYIPSAACCLLISPVLDLETRYDFWARYARIAVDYYNTDKEEDEKLVFLKLLKVNDEIGSPLAYLTLEVKDKADVCHAKIYQAKVDYGPGNNKVKEFRQKPSQQNPSQQT